MSVGDHGEYPHRGCIGPDFTDDGPVRWSEWVPRCAICGAALELRGGEAACWKVVGPAMVAHPRLQLRIEAERRRAAVADSGPDEGGPDGPE